LSSFACFSNQRENNRLSVDSWLKLAGVERKWSIKKGIKRPIVTGNDCDCLAGKHDYRNGFVGGSVLIDRQFNQDR